MTLWAIKIYVSHISRSHSIDPILTHTRPPNSTLLYFIKQHNCKMKKWHKHDDNINEREELVL